ncbi:hypothetical protein [Numidum massiliense]|uniref:hypothetical protein n=1 Tax=Numidum massiliense TaxID=1522315 RepID=UPI0006D55E6C|nr:hypothetical protein [Numidum massiliense]
MKSINSVDEEVARKAKESVEKVIREEYEGVETIEFTDVTKSPVSGLMVRGIVNGKGGFSASVNNNYRVGSIGSEEGFPPLKKEYEEKSR